MFPTIPQSLVFRVRSVAELLCLPQLLTEYGLAKLHELPTRPWQAISPPCGVCGEREAADHGHCWYCAAVEAKSPRDYQPWPGRAILLTCPQSLVLGEMFSAWHVQGELVMILDSRVSEQPATPGICQEPDSLDSGQTLLIGLPTRKIGRRLLALLAWLEDHALDAQITVLPLSLRQRDDYLTGELLALADHHWRYFPQTRTYVKIFSASRHLASLEYAARQDLFWDSDRCRQCLARIAELRDLLGEENMAVLQSCIHENELNRHYQFNKLLSVCTPLQRQTLLALRLTDGDRQLTKLWVELAHYVE